MVSALGYSSTSLLGSVSNSYWHIPILTSGPANGKRAEVEVDHTNDTTQGSEHGYLLGIKPGLVAEMKGLVRLILHMKVKRDRQDGRRVSLRESLHWSDIPVH